VGKVGNEYTKETRQAGNIELQFRKTKSAQKSLFYEGVKMYNALPAEIKNCDRLDLLKRRLKAHITIVNYISQNVHENST